jgi:membrane protease YdiL (CAAX protease family)
MLRMVAAYAMLLAVDRYGYYLCRKSAAGFWLRRFVYLAPLLVPLFLVDQRPSWRWHGTAVALALSVTLVAVILNMPAIRRMFNPTLAELIGPPGAWYVAAETLTKVGGAVLEELFFRWYVLAVVQPYLGWWSLPVLGAMFVAHHGVHPRAAQLFSGVDYVGQFIAGAGYSGVAIMSGSLLAPVAGHLAYNTLMLAGVYYRLPRVLRLVAGSRVGVATPSPGAHPGTRKGGARDAVC